MNAATDTVSATTISCEGARAATREGAGVGVGGVIVRYWGERVRLDGGYE